MLHYLLPTFAVLSYDITLSHEINHPIFLCNYAIVCSTHSFLSCLRVFHLQINCDTDETFTKDGGDEEELQTRNPQLSRTYPHQRHRRHISPDEIDATIRKVFNLSSEPHSSSFSVSLGKSPLWMNDWLDEWLLACACVCLRIAWLRCTCGDHFIRA